MLFGLYAALEIRELENSFFDVTNRLLVCYDVLFSATILFCSLQILVKKMLTYKSTGTLSGDFYTKCPRCMGLVWITFYRYVAFWFKRPINPTIILISVFEKQGYIFFLKIKISPKPESMCKSHYGNQDFPYWPRGVTLL